MNSHVAHHFDDAEQQMESATLGMWLFLATEVLFFGGLFAGYLVYRSLYPDAFVVGSRELDVWIGTLNTGVLLLSSLTMALAVRSAQISDRRALLKFLAATTLLGIVFLGAKGLEYQHKFEEHKVPGTEFHLKAGSDEADAGHVELFFSLYFAMTGLHALHMVIGIAVMSVIFYFAWMGRYTAEYFTPVEMAGLYWHFVDIVWVFLFPLLYLIH